MTTPFNLSLQNELDVEWARFANKWLFDWHKINMEGKSTDVDDFQGGRITVGGIKFQGQIQQIYWQSIGRYLRGKIDEIFGRWEVTCTSYPDDLKQVSLHDLEVSLKSFIARIVKQATETDRALRGGGFPDSVPVYNSTGVQSSAFAHLLRLIQAHQLLIERRAPKPAAEVPSPPPSFKARFEAWVADNKGLLTIIGIIVGIAGLLFKLFVG